MYLQFRSSGPMNIYRGKGLVCRDRDVLEVGEGPRKISQDVAVYLLDTFPKNFFRFVEEAQEEQEEKEDDASLVHTSSEDSSSSKDDEEKSESEAIQEKVEEGVQLTGEAKQVLEAMGDRPMKPGEIAKSMNTHHLSIAHTLSLLISEKYIERDNDGYYSVVKKEDNKGGN